MSDFFRSRLESSSSNTFIEISINLRSLVNMDLLSKSDPFIILYYRNPTNSTPPEQFPLQPNPSLSIDGDWNPYEITETIWDNLNPDFVHKFIFPWSTPSLLSDIELRLKVLDRDSEDASLNKHDFIGQSDFKLSEIISSPNNHLMLPLLNEKGKTKGGLLHGNKSLGTVHLFAEILEIPQDTSTQHGFNIEFGFKSNCTLPQKRAFFYTISRMTLDSNFYTRVFRSGVLFVKNYSGNTHEMDDFVFQVQKLNDSELFVGDMNRKLRFELYENKKSGAHEVLMRIECTMNELMNHDEEKDDLVVDLCRNKHLIHAEAYILANSWNVASQNLGLISIRLANLSWTKGYL